MTLATIALVDICETHGNLIKLVCAYFTTSIIVYIYDFDLFFTHYYQKRRGTLRQ